MNGAAYPVRTIFQMADIPEEALPRFMAELPAILAQLRMVKDLASRFNKGFGDVAVLNFEDAGDPLWTDDDRGEVTITTEMPDGGEHVVTGKLGGAA
jgi:hypothetical protein